MRQLGQKPDSHLALLSLFPQKKQTLKQDCSDCKLCVCFGVYHVLSHDEEMLFFLVQNEIGADGGFLLYGNH